MTPNAEQHRHAILVAADRHGARNVRLFGSVARGMTGRRATSISWSIWLLDVVAVEQALEALLHRPVDVLTEQGLAPALRERITAGARAL